MSTIEETRTQPDVGAYYEEVVESIRGRAKLRAMGEKIGLSPEDLAGEAVAKYLKVLEERPDDAAAIEDPVGYMVRSAFRHTVDEFRRGREEKETPTEPGAYAIAMQADDSIEDFDEKMDRTYNEQLLNMVLAGLDTDDAIQVAAGVHEGLSSREIEKRYGYKRTSVQRAWKAFAEAFEAETGEAGSRRTRSRAIAYVGGFMTAAQKARLEDRMETDWILRMEVRRLQLGAEHAHGLVPPAMFGGVATQTDTASLADRAGAIVDKVRDTAYQVASRGGDNHAEAATGAATSAGFATKAVVAVCIGGGAVGGACVQQGIVDLPGAGANDGAQEKTVGEVTTPTETTPAPLPEPAPVTDEPSEQTQAPAAAAPPKPTPVQEVQNEVGFEPAPAAPSSSSSSSEFGGGGGSSGGGGASSGGGGGEFGGP